MRKILNKLLDYLSIFVGDCQCDCHSLAYNSCGNCRETHSSGINADKNKQYE